MVKAEVWRIFYYIYIRGMGAMKILTFKLFRLLHGDESSLAKKDSSDCMRMDARVSRVEHD